MKKSMVVSLVFAVVLLACALSASAQTVAAASSDPALAAVFAQRTFTPGTPGIRLAATTCGPFCDTSLNLTTATVSGSGPDCTTATNSLNSQLLSLANADCQNNWTGLGSCNRVLHTTSACTLVAPGTYQVQGYYSYSCRDTTC